MSTRTPAQRKAITAAIARKAKRTAVVGHGAYRKVAAKRSPAKKGMKYPGAGAGIGTAIGGAFGGPAGAAIGGLLGGAAHKLANSIFGFGDYEVQRNALILDETNNPPLITNSGKEFIIRHREYVTDVYSASGAANTPSVFALQSFFLNPGDFNTFPWMSALADKFEQYRVEGMVIEFKSLYSDAVVTQNGSIGSVVLATEYNAAAPAFTSKQAMENYQFAQSCKPSLSVLHPIECARPQNVLTELYVRPGALPVGEDRKTYDFGLFQIASQGIPLGAAGAAVNLGELWISYQIALLKPKIPTAASTDIDSGYAHFYTAVPAVGAVTAALPMPNNGSVVKATSSNIDVYQPTGSNNTLSFNLGPTPRKFQLDFYWDTDPVVNDPTAVWRAPTLGFTNCSSLQPSNSGPIPNILVPVVSGIGNGTSMHYMIQVPAYTPSAPISTIVLSATGLYSTTANTRINAFINSIPTNVN